MLHYNFYESKNQNKQLLVMLHGFISDATTYL
ncbi:2-succinyl-6-hydroxy-2,4-cyclohexadiene-1-carboxylate synthase, partial [Paraburkholderia tropica]